jgi:peptide-methionine (S)-S-oxide reductase
MHFSYQHFPPKEHKGILKTSVGFTGGKELAKAPSYYDVCSGMTGHAEAVHIEFDPGVVSYGELVGEYPSTFMNGNDVPGGLNTWYQSSFTEPMTQQLSTPRETITALVRTFMSSLTVLVLDPVSTLAYRSPIFTHSPAQATTAREVTAAVEEKHFKPKGRKIVTKMEDAGEWYDAEDDHQEYLFKNPSGYQCPTHRLWW